MDSRQRQQPQQRQHQQQHKNLIRGSKPKRITRLHGSVAWSKHADCVMNETCYGLALLSLFRIWSVWLLIHSNLNNANDRRRSDLPILPFHWQFYHGSFLCSFAIGLWLECALPNSKRLFTHAHLITFSFASYFALFLHAAFVLTCINASVSFAYCISMKNEDKRGSFQLCLTQTACQYVKIHLSHLDGRTIGTLRLLRFFYGLTLN